MEYIRIEERDFCFMGLGSKITGQLHLKGPTRLYSHIEGEIVMLDKAELCIEKNGSVLGTINCHHIEIFGRVEGVIKSTGNVMLHPTARILGEVNALQLIISPGARIEGDIHTIQ